MWRWIEGTTAPVGKHRTDSFTACTEHGVTAEGTLESGVWVGCISYLYYGDWLLWKQETAGEESEREICQLKLLLFWSRPSTNLGWDTDLSQPQKWTSESVERFFITALASTEEHTHLLYRPRPNPESGTYSSGHRHTRCDPACVFLQCVLQCF